MTNTICITKCNKCLPNKSSNGIMPKHKILTFKHRDFTVYINLGKQKASLFPQKHWYCQYRNSTYELKYILK